MNWDKRWMDLAMLNASWSKDQSRKIGAVIVDHRNVLLSIGWNGFPRGINDDKPERHERPIKYKWTEHAERNAIYNAAANGHRLLGCSIYASWYPCADCARGIIQSGIAKVISVRPNFSDERWGADFQMVDAMFEEAGIVIKYIEGYGPIEVDEVKL